MASSKGGSLQRSVSCRRIIRVAAVTLVVVALVAVDMALLAYVLNPAADQWLVSVCYKGHFPFHG